MTRPNLRLVAPAYRGNETNHCPGCGRTHWIIGRITAECGFCATALPLAESSCRRGTARVIHAPRVSRLTVIPVVISLGWRA